MRPIDMSQLRVVELDISLYRGTSPTLTFELPITGSVLGPDWQVELCVRRTQASPDPLALNAPATIVNPGSETARAIFAVPLTTDQTLALEARDHVYSLSRTNQDSATTLFVGTLHVRADVTHEV